MFSKQADGLGIECVDLLVQHLCDSHGRGFPLAEQIVGIIDRDHRVGLFHGIEEGFGQNFGIFRYF